MTDKKTPTRAAGTGSRKTADKTAKSFVEKQGQEIGKGGTLEVPIVVEPMPSKGYSKRSMKPEEYPFSKLEPSIKAGDQLIGPSFFIPEDEKPLKILATARKRHFPALFWTRKVVVTIGGKEVKGSRVWRAPLEEQEAKLAKAEKTAEA